MKKIAVVCPGFVADLWRPWRKSAFRAGKLSRRRAEPTIPSFLASTPSQDPSTCWKLWRPPGSQAGGKNWSPLRSGWRASSLTRWLATLRPDEQWKECRFHEDPWGVCFPDFQTLDMFGPMEMLGAMRHDIETVIVAETADPVPSIHGQRIMVDKTLADGSDYDFLFLPGGDTALEAAKSTAVRDWIIATSERAGSM